MATGTDVVSKDSRWEDVVWLEQQLRLEARHKEDDLNDDGASLRAWYGHLSLMFKRLADGNSYLLPPRDLMLVMSSMCDYLHRGIIPEPVSRVSVRKRRVIGPEEERHISLAAAYIQAVNAKAIPGRWPIKTISGRFGVVRQTAQSWKAWPVSEETRAWIIRDRRSFLEALKKAAAKYKRAGRSKAGIEHRGRQSK